MPCNSINSTLEIFTLFLMVILLIAMLLKQKKQWQDKLFICTLFFHALNTSCDLITWRVAGEPGVAALMIATVGNFCAYLFNAFAYFSFLTLIYVTLRKQIKPQSAVEWILAGSITLMSAGMVILTLTNFRTELLYTLTSDNTFSWGPLSVWYDTVILFQFSLLLPLVLLSPKLDRRKAMLSFLFYAGIPAMATVLQHWYSSLMLLYPTVAISLLLMYTRNQRDQEFALLQKELELADSRMTIMLSQIQPHFLYNALGTIKHLCEVNPAIAKVAVDDFSNFLRGNLNSLTADKPISFEQELNHTKNYLHIEKLRFQDRLKIEYHIEATLFRLPTLTLQPIVENAVRYGVTKREDGGAVTISSKETDTAFIVTVEDDGIGFDPVASREDGDSHIGISNVRERLASMVGGTLEIQSMPGVGTVATIIIPKEDA